MKYRNSVAIIRTRKENTVGCHMVVAKRYMQLMPSQFVYKDCYICNGFEILENVGGDVIIKTTDDLKNVGIEFENHIRIRNVEEIEIMSEHEV